VLVCVGPVAFWFYLQLSAKQENKIGLKIKVLILLFVTDIIACCNIQKYCILALQFLFRHFRKIA